MILKLDMKHQGMELYKIYLNHDPGMTLTYFTACHLKGKTCSKMTPGVILTLPWCYIHAYIHSSIGVYLGSQVSVHRTIGPLV